VEHVSVTSVKEKCEKMASIFVLIAGINLPYNLGLVTGPIPLQKFFHLTLNYSNSLEKFPNFKLLAKNFPQFYEKGTLIFRARLISG
jgi:hypothetical protein